jgi:hypothetical protein
MKAEVLTAVIMKSTVVWDVTLCSLGDIYQCFKETAASILMINKLSEGASMQAALHLLLL